jgi:putative hemolysin
MIQISKLTSHLASLLSSSKAKLRVLLGLRKGGEVRMSRDEIAGLVRGGIENGAPHDVESRLLEGVCGFGALDVYDIMIPRPKMIWIEINSRHNDIWPAIIRSTQEVFPVYEEHWDNLAGVVSVKEIYAHLAAGAEISFRDLMQIPLLVPETQKASELLEEFRSSGQRAAFVLDEFGGVSGMVTLIDLLESIVGEVPSKQERLAMPIRRRTDGSCLIDGFFEIEKLGRHLAGFLPPEGAGADFQTVAGWFLTQLDRLPEEGIIIVESGWSFEIVDMDLNRVDKVLAKPVDPPPPDPAAVSGKGTDAVSAA